MYATRAAIAFIRTRLNSVWNTNQLRITVLSVNQATLTTLGKLWKTETHNPRWGLNRNWELLSGIKSDLEGQSLKLKAAQDLAADGPAAGLTVGGNYSDMKNLLRSAPRPKSIKVTTLTPS
jgi:hypothetical protein